MQRRLKRGDAQINRNLLNYPLARDVRIADCWTRSLISGRWEHQLPGNSRIKFRMPADAANLRCPSAFDMNVLLVYLREARVSKERKVEFASMPALLEALRLDDTNLQPPSSEVAAGLGPVVDPLDLLWPMVSADQRQKGYSYTPGAAAAAEGDQMAAANCRRG